MNGPKTSKTLLQRMFEGNSGAWYEFDRRYDAFILRSLKRNGVKDNLLEEAYQDVRIRMIKVVQTWDPKRGFRPYLCAVIRNVASGLVDASRKRMEKRQIQFSALEAGGNGNSRAQEGCVDIKDFREKEPPDRLAEEEQRIIRENALALLREKEHCKGHERQYEAFLSYVVQGAKTTALAERFGVQEPTIRSWVHRGRIQFKKCLIAAFREYVGQNWRDQWLETFPDFPLSGAGKD